MSRLILVVANETLEEPALHDAVSAPAYAASADVFVVAPAAGNDRWTTEQRLAAAVYRFVDVGVRARGAVGDGDPLLAIDDALGWYRADELIVSTPLGREPAWLAGARDRFDLPILHVVAGNHAEQLEAA
jgi:hypothetical protein